MFLYFMGDEEKKSFLGLAYKVALIDGVFHENEQKMMKFYERESGIPLGKEKDENVVLLCSAFKSKQSKLYCIAELLAIALSDAKYHISEKGFIRQVASEFNIDNTTVYYLKHWVMRQNAMTAEITEFVGEE